MKDYHNKTRHAVYFNRITGVKFQEEYAKISESTDKVPVASTLIPILCSNGCTLYASAEKEGILTETQYPLYDAFIYYEKKHTEQQDPKPKLKLDI